MDPCIACMGANQLKAGQADTVTMRVRGCSGRYP